MKKIIFSVLIFLASLSMYGQIRLVAVNPSLGTVSIKNFGTGTVNVSTHRLCHLFNYPIISSLTIVSGSMSSLASGATVVVSGIPLNVTASDLALYLPTGTFTDINNMLDFVQWGSGGNGRETVAVNKGIWDVGTFIAVSPPYQYTGDGVQQFGVSFWQTATGINENDFSRAVTVFPNPAQNRITINSPNHKVNFIKVFNLLGEAVLVKNAPYLNETYQLDVAGLPKGEYILIITAKETVAVKKITLVK